MKYILGLILLIAMACSPKTVKEAQQGDIVTVPSEPDTTQVTEIITEEPDNEPAIQMFLEFQKTSCYGKCPVFMIRAFSDGRLIYHGKSNVDKTGYYEAFLDQKDRQLIFQKANEIGFFNLESNYPSSGPPISDLPKTKTYLKQQGSAHRVINNYDAPLVLQQFESFLDELFSGINWIKVNGD